MPLCVAMIANDLMGVSAPEQSDAVGVLRDLLGTLGFSLVVLAQLPDEEGDTAEVRGEAARANGAAHDAKVLGETATRLLG